MLHPLPPMNALRVFEAVARTENLTSAARELHVTQSAVSRQIAALESYLGIELFRRERHGVSLTRSGRAYAEKVIPAFSQLASATDQLIKDSSQGALRVRTYTTFAARWLIPRLTHLRQRYPEMEVHIINGVPDVDFDRDPVDVAIQFGNGKWPRVQADQLFPDKIEPVCSKRYLAENLHPGQGPEALLGMRLLVSHYRRTDWDDWLAATGMAPHAAGAERMSFSTSVLTWQAAFNGLGIAIGQTSLLKDEFASGRLVRPFSMPVLRDKAYYLVRPEVQRESRKVRLFRDWLLDEVKVDAGA
ncbi:MAG: transcriptional regulator GcvA [Noviherbaspirillum sp.]